jgi:putative ABC transport system substrate-binding protein
VSRRWLLRSLASALLAVPAAVRAQPQRHAIGVLRVGKPPETFIDGLRQGLREAGRPEGANLVIEYGIADSAGGLPNAARELLDRKVSVLIASGTKSVLPAKHATATVPIVFVAAVDPVAAGVVGSLSRPGGNITGVTAMHATWWRSASRCSRSCCRGSAASRSWRVG